LQALEIAVKMKKEEERTFNLVVSVKATDGIIVAKKQSVNL
jgi:hypothetical protein